MKYLGIVIDKKLNFDAHIQYTTERCTKLINALAKSAKLDWGLQHGALRTIYKGAILPLLSYGSPVWIEALRKKHNHNRFTRVQRLINIKITKAFRTTSTEALCILSGLTPISIKLEEIAKEYNTRKKSRQRNRPLDYKNWPHPADVPAFEEAVTNKEYTVEAYTDGSKTEEGVGSGVAVFVNNVLKHQKKYKLNTQCSNNQVEQYAILMALKTIADLELNPDIPYTAVIYTDSKITLNSIKNTSNHNFLIEQIRKQLQTIGRQNWKIDFGWVKAHIGIYGNELADRLAKQATTQEAVECYTKKPRSAILRQLRTASIEEWQDEWQKTAKGSETKNYFPTVKYRLQQKTHLTTNITTLLTGHGRLKAYYHRFHLIDNPICTCKEGDQNVDHIIFNCRMLKKEKNQLQINIAQKGGHWPPNKTDLVGKFRK